MGETNEVSNEQPKFKSSVWRPTSYLRWVKKDVPFDMINQNTVLQQKWEALNGEEEWRDIKIEVN